MESHPRFVALVIKPTAPCHGGTQLGTGSGFFDRSSDPVRGTALDRCTFLGCALALGMVAVLLPVLIINDSGILTKPQTLLEFIQCKPVPDRMEQN